MTRADITYNHRREGQAGIATGQAADAPAAGFFRTRLRAGGVRGGVRIWHGPPHDPLTGEVLDRSWRWQAEFNGEAVELARVWPVCGGDPISEAEYQSYVERAGWARESAPDSAYADPRKRLNALSLTTPLPF